MNITLEEAKTMVGAGWSGILEMLYAVKPESVLVEQVKEKWGGLRFYVSDYPKGYSETIDEAELKSFTICEECGEPGTLRYDLSWHKTLCDKHYADRKHKIGPGAG